MEMLKWLRSEGCPWDKETCVGAADTGNFHVLKWAVDNGCPYEIDFYNRQAYEFVGVA